MTTKTAKRPRLNLVPLLQTLSIQTKALTFERLDLSSEFAWAQREFIQVVENAYNENKPVRIIVLKARQLGISTITAGVFYCMGFIHANSNSVIISNDNSSSAGIYDKIQKMWDSWPFKVLYATQRNSMKRITWKDTLSDITLKTSRNIQSGRGSTIHNLHGSEVAFWERAEELMTGLRQTIPNEHGTIMVLESTANGANGYFYKLWCEAVAGENDFIPLFFPWYRHYEYRKDPIFTNTSPDNFDDYEQWLFKEGQRNHCTEQEMLWAISWRRWAIPNLQNHDEEKFKQEYPATPEEAFLTTGHHVFPLTKLAECFIEMPCVTGYIQAHNNEYTFKKDPLGELSIYAYPSSSREAEYFVAGDPSRTTYGDGACIQVINRRTLRQVAVWHGHCDPITFGKKMEEIGHYYNTAILCPEIEGPGYATIGYLRDRYPRIWQYKWPDKMPGKTQSNFLGWSTNYQRKQWAMGQMTYFLGEHRITIHDRKTYDQMRDYVILENGEMAGATLNDDAVMALCIATVASTFENEPPPFSDGRYGAPTSQDFYGTPLERAY